MGVIDQLKAANAARRMYNRLCNTCKVRITQRFAADHKAHNQDAYNGKTIIEETKKVLCPRCISVYEEALGNK